MQKTRSCQLSWAVLIALALLAGQQAVHAQDTNNGQGKILWAIGQWLSGGQSGPISAMGWTDGGNPCLGSWQGVSCNGQGYVTSINLSGRGLTGLIPSDPGLWVGLTALTNLDLSNNQVTGSVPAAIKSAPLLTNVNLGDNRALCGYLPNGLGANTQNTGIGTACSSQPAQTPPPPATPTPAPLSPATAPPSGVVTLPDGSPTPPVVASPNPSPAAEPEAKPAPAPTVISSAPICSCALRGFGSQDCTGSLANVCRGSNPPAVCSSSSNVTNDVSAATAMGQYLADACFKGQNMDTSICTCVQNLLGNDCAKARVSLCVKGDPLCLPIQNVVSESGTAAAPEAVQQVAQALDAQCSVAEPTQAGVKATMEFPELSMAQYITKQYTQNVANALSSVTNVPTSSISALDVRPFTGAARADSPKRMLLQAGSNGVQATYFLSADDPNSVSQRLSAAAADGTLSARLAQYGITAQAGGLRVQNYLQPATAASSKGFPLWALAPIIVGTLLLIGALSLLVFFCCRKKSSRGEKAAEYAPAGSTKNPIIIKTSSATSSRTDDLGGSRDMPYKNSYDSPTYTTTARAGGYKPDTNAYKAAAAPPTYAAPKQVTAPTVYDTAPVTNSMMVRGPATAAPSGLAAVAAGLAGTGAAAAAGVPRIGSSRNPPRPESPASSKGSGSNIGPAGIAGHSTKARVVELEESIARAGSGGSSTLTPWEAASRPAGAPSMQLQTKGSGVAAAAGSSGVTGGPVRAAGAAGAPAGSAGLQTRGSGPLGAAGGSELAGQGSGNPAWKTNVRAANGQLHGAGSSGSSMLANPAGKSSQQAERAKFWAQFQETWQQVRSTQNVDHEPGSPSSGTNWTDITDARTFRHQ